MGSSSVGSGVNCKGSSEPGLRARSVAAILTSGFNPQPMASQIMAASNRLPRILGHSVWRTIRSTRSIRTSSRSPTQMRRLFCLSSSRKARQCRLFRSTTSLKPGVTAGVLKDGELAVCTSTSFLAFHT
ncbi:hypothetical protein D3C87_1329510 [compost metagenome]